MKAALAVGLLTAVLGLSACSSSTPAAPDAPYVPTATWSGPPITTARSSTPSYSTTQSDRSAQDQLDRLQAQQRNAQSEAWAAQNRQEQQMRELQHQQQRDRDEQARLASQCPTARSMTGPFYGCYH